MRQVGLSGLTKVKRGRTTIRVPGGRVADDLVERRFRPDQPDVLWVADITYLRSWEGWVYLAAVQDGYSRRIVGWSMADHMRAELVVDALEMALHRRRPGPGLISLRPGQSGRIHVVVATPRCDEVAMGRPAGWMRELTGRSAMKSPGKPSHQREVELWFWREVAEGLSTEAAAAAVGVSSAAGVRWFRERGGMATLLRDPETCRYLCFAEREEIALLRAEGRGVRTIAREIGRS